MATSSCWWQLNAHANCERDITMFPDNHRALYTLGDTTFAEQRPHICRIFTGAHRICSMQLIILRNITWRKRIWSAKASSKSTWMWELKKRFQLRDENSRHIILKMLLLSAPVYCVHNFVIVCYYGFSTADNALAKSGYKVRTDEILASTHQSIDIEKLHTNFLNSLLPLQVDFYRDFYIW
jgi:hypothetical protein